MPAIARTRSRPTIGSPPPAATWIATTVPVVGMGGALAGWASSSVVIAPTLPGPERGLQAGVCWRRAERGAPRGAGGRGRRTVVALDQVAAVAASRLRRATRSYPAQSRPARPGPSDEDGPRVSGPERDAKSTASPCPSETTPT